MLKVSIMITTLNRWSELERTLRMLTALEPLPHEIWVVADGCTDGTATRIRNDYPQIALIEHEISMGSVHSRAEVMEQVTGDLVLTLDDDSYPEQRDCLALIPKTFEDNPNLAIATFPQRSDEYPPSLVQKDFGIERDVRSFSNSGACLRVTVYRDLPGFEPFFFHAYEEPDYALQCVANGWSIRFLPQITIRHHFSSLERNEIRTHQRHARNEFWSTLMRCPFPYAIIVYRVISHARYSVSRGIVWLLREPSWWWQAFMGIPRAVRRRNPVSWEGYWKWLSLPNQ
jgi:GT2 family glycosyltransferase